LNPPLTLEKLHKSLSQPDYPAIKTGFLEQPSPVEDHMIFMLGGILHPPFHRKDHGILDGIPQ